MLKSRAGQWVVTGIVLGVVLSLAVIGIALRGRLAVATGLDRTLGAPTIPPSVFAEASEEPTPDAAGNLQPAATAPTPGPAPSGPTLTKRLAALDTSKLTDTAGKPAVVAWEILDASTGEVISARNATSMLIPASNTKTLTCTAVFNAFDDQERFVTKVTQPAPGSIVLVGGGDPLLTSEPATTGTYPQPPSLRSLAIQTAKALKSAGTTNVTLGYDTSWFEGPGWASTWPEGYRNQVTPITALWADEGKVGGVRQPDPAAAAATIFAKQLGEQGVTVTGPPSSASGNGTQIAAVESLPVHVLAELRGSRPRTAHEARAVGTRRTPRRCFRALTQQQILTPHARQREPASHHRRPPDRHPRRAPRRWRYWHLAETLHRRHLPPRTRDRPSEDRHAQLRLHPRRQHHDR